MNLFQKTTFVRDYCTPELQTRFVIVDARYIDGLNNKI